MIQLRERKLKDDCIYLAELKYMQARLCEVTAESRWLTCTPAPCLHSKSHVQHE